MAALGIAKVYDRPDAIGFGQRNRRNDDSHTYLIVYEPSAATSDPRRHWCLRANSESAVRAFFEAGLGAGGAADGEPGLRTRDHPGYFAAVLKDPDGNRVEAVFHQASSET